MPRRRIPAEIRELTGARVRPEHLVDEDVRPTAGRPPMPAFVRQDREAAKEWRRIVPLLEVMNVLAKIHLAAVAMYCAAWSNVVALATKLNAEKQAAAAAGGAAGDALVARRASGIERPSGTLTTLHEAMAACNRHLGELGLSPAAISRLVATRPDAQLGLPGIEDEDPVARRLRLIGGKESA